MKKAAFLSIFALTGLVVTGCNSPTNTNGGGSSQAAPTGNTQGVTSNSISVGISGPLTGPIAAYGAVAEGANAYFQYVNDNGGINGRKINVVMLDDQYQPDLGVVNAKKLASDKVFATVAFLGTAVNEAADPILLKSGIPVASVSSGSSQLTFPVVKDRWGLEPTYTMSANVLLKYAVKQNHVKTIGVFGQNDDLGQEALAALKKAAAEHGIKIIANTTYNATDTDFSTQAQTMMKANPDAIFEYSVPKPTAQFMKSLKQLGYKGQQYVSDISGDPETMFPLAGQAFNGVYSDSWLVPLNDPKAKDFQAEWKKVYPNQRISELAEYGWVDAQVVAYGIQQSGNDLSLANFEKHMDSINDWKGSLSAGPITYSPTFHAGTNQVLVVQADGTTKTMKPVSGLIEYDQTSNPLQ